jgi:hypothetical protein
VRTKHPLAEIVSPADLGIGDVIILLRQGRYRFRIDEIVHHKDGSATIWEDREDTGGTSLTTTEIYGFLDRNAEVCRIVSANFHERMADIVRRLHEWNNDETFNAIAIMGIADHAAALWAEYQEAVKCASK